MRVTQETKTKTRGAILDAARKLFGEKGFEETTTRAIAVEAKIATGTLFNYFSSKEAIAMTFVREALSGASDDFAQRRRGDESLEEDCFAHAIAGFRRLAPYRHLVGAVIDSALGPFSTGESNPHAEVVRADHLETVAELLAMHGIAMPLSPVAVHLYWTLYLGALGCWAADKSPNQEETLAVLDQSMRLFVASLNHKPEVSNGTGT
ncbi:MAG TPA: TetR/AcrR family transcriptional regulator [Pirellulales bacterium]|jgi:AcrR family transcriptional regulator|nr:TetR/AcrR family transcriptional regulator [Pirellulales bacterium]